MKVLLVFPEFPVSFWSFTHALKILGRKAVLPPLGLLTVAALLPGEWEKRLVDTNVRPLTDEDLAWADCVFVGGMGAQWKGAHEIIGRAKAAGKKVIAGGPLFTCAYALFQAVDHFVLNEGEMTVPALAADLEKGCAKRLYRSREFADMTKSPAPLWELAEINQYACVGIQYTRGCPFDCDFCNVTTMLGRKPRIKTPGQIIAELDGLKRAGWNGRVFFVDDNLIGNRKALKEELLPALWEWQKKNGMLPLCTQASINLADDEKMMRGMVEAGFDSVFVGIESSDTESLEECSKSQNRNRDLIADIKKLQRAGLEVQAGFIVGFDNDSDKTFEQQFEFIQKSGIMTAMVGQLQAPPGTRLQQRMGMEGRLSGMSLGDNTDGTTNIVPRMGVEKLRDGHAALLGRLYETGAYYVRLRTFLREYREAWVGTGRRKLRGEDVRVLMRALYILGIKGAERWEFWKLLAWTLMPGAGRAKKLAWAVRLASFGHHQRLMAEELLVRVETGDLPRLPTVAELVEMAERAKGTVRLPVVG
jgi:radical SAM superfamily enzyme YgiQ (UPF0313 family)